MKYWFIFVKDAVMLEKNADGSRTIPMAENPPIELKPWTHVMEIAPMEDGTEVRAASIDYPIAENDRYETCPLRKSFYHLPTATTTAFLMLKPRTSDLNIRPIGRSPRSSMRRR